MSSKSNFSPKYPVTYETSEAELEMQFGHLIQISQEEFKQQKPFKSFNYALSTRKIFFTVLLFVLRQIK
jgi:hypothetical protein